MLFGDGEKKRRGGEAKKDKRCLIVWKEFKKRFYEDQFK